MEILAAIVLIGVALFVGALLGGLVFYFTWNDFVVNHLSGAHHTSLGAAILVGLAIGVLTASSRSSVSTS